MGQGGEGRQHRMCPRASCRSGDAGGRAQLSTQVLRRIGVNPLTSAHYRWKGVNLRLLPACPVQAEQARGAGEKSHLLGLWESCLWETPGTERLGGRSRVATCCVCNLGADGRLLSGLVLAELSSMWTTLTSPVFPGPPNAAGGE